MDTIIKTQIIDLIHREVIPCYRMYGTYCRGFGGRKSGGSAGA